MKIRKPALLWRYIFREVSSPTLLGLAVYVTVFLMNALFELAELAIRKDLPIGTVVRILLFYLPRVLVMTIPMSILLGILVGVGRMSTDSEVIALRASGVSYRKIVAPVLALGLLAWTVTSWLIIKVEPRANYRRHRIYQELSWSADLRREIKPRVFFEQIPGMLLYADEVHQNGDFLEKVFIHQTTEDNKELVTVARRAQIDYDRQNGVAQFYLENGTSHSTTPGEAEAYQVSHFDRQMIRREPDESFRLRSSLLTRPAPKNFREQSLGELSESVAKARKTIPTSDTLRRVVGSIQAVAHERYALPFASVVFALVALPLGVMNRRGGRASGFSLSIGIAVVYWILFLTGQNLTSQGRLSPYVGLWIGNAVFGLLGIALLALRERSESLNLLRLLPAWPWLQRPHRLPPSPPGHPPSEPGQTPPAPQGGRVVPLRRPDGNSPEEVRRGQAAPPSTRVGRYGRLRSWAFGGVAAVVGLLSASYNPFLLVALILLALILIFSTTIDRYVLARFSTILAGSVAALFFLLAIYEFINLIDDLVERHLPLTLALSYVKFRSPWLLSQVLPMSSLVATLMCFGIMSRFNEVTAIKASGTSIYRLTMPVVLVTTVLSALAYINQDYLVPSANVRATQIRDSIRGRGARSYAQRERRWVFGEEGRLYNFRNYLPPPLQVISGSGSGTFQGFSAYLLDKGSFALRQRVFARTATFDGGHWVLHDGWVRDFLSGGESFETFSEKHFAFPEGPGYFIKDWKTPEQMTYAELRTFVRDLRGRGYDVQELMVDLYGKTAFPLVCLTMVVIGLPFCFRMGRRGSLYGIGIALALVAAFLLTFSTTNALGGVGVIPPFLAAWAPNILFAGSGLYLLLRTGT